MVGLTMWQEAGSNSARRARRWRRSALLVCVCAVLGLVAGKVGHAQENPLNDVQTPAPPPPAKTPEELKPLIDGGADVAAKATTHRNARLRIDVNLVQVPLTVTDPMNRLVTGLEKDNFAISDNNIGQTIKYFSS